MTCRTSFGQRTSLDILVRSRESVVTVEAPAKINLYLHVTGQRPNGYHDLDSVIVFTTVHDVITVTPHDTLTVQLSGPFGNHLAGLSNNNLAIRAAQLLAELVGIPAKAKITLNKILPVSAGLGGGSADAAAVLRALCRLWLVCPSEKELAAVALTLGADVPVCLKGCAAHVSGIGEVIKPLKLGAAPAAVVLVNPGLPLSTKTVFEAHRGPYSSPRPFNFLPSNIHDLARSLAQRSNDLTDTARTLCPEIDEVLNALNRTAGCQLARLTGSGPSCFGLFDGIKDAKTAATQISALKTDWWVKHTGLVADVTTLA